MFDSYSYKKFRSFICFVCLFVLLTTIIDGHCMDQNGPLQRQGVQVQTGVCPWPVGDDGADMPERDAFDASALHRSKRSNFDPFSTSSSDFETRS